MSQTEQKSLSELMTEIQAQNTEKRQTQIRNKLDEMVKKYGIDKRMLLSPTKPSAGKPHLICGQPEWETRFGRAESSDKVA